MAVADAEGALGGLDQAVDVGEALALRNAQPVVERQDQQRGQSLGRGRHVVEAAGGDRHGEGRDRLGPMGFQIGQGHRRTGGLEIRRDVAGEGAAVGAAQAVDGQPPKGARQGGLPERLAAAKEGLGEAGHRFQLSALGREQGGEASGDRRALFGMADGRFQQARQGQGPAAQLQHRFPA